MHGFERATKLKYYDAVKAKDVASNTTLEDYYKDNPKISPVLLDLVLKMLALNPSERYSVNDCLKHSWFSEDDDKMCMPAELPISEIDSHEFKFRQEKKQRDQELLNKKRAAV